MLYVSSSSIVGQHKFCGEVEFLFQGFHIREVAPLILLVLQRVKEWFSIPRSQEV